MSPKDKNWEEYCMEAEILSEYTSEILAQFSKSYSDICNIDEHGPIALIENHLLKIKKQIFQENTTLEDLHNIKSKFDYAREILLDKIN